VRARVRPTKENATNLPFFRQTRKTRRSGIVSGDVSQRVGVEVIRTRGVDVPKLIKRLIANAAAEVANTYYYYTILRVHLAVHEDYKEICEDTRLEDHPGRCLPGAGELLEPGEFDPSDAVSYYPQDREAGYLLLCTAKARSNLRLRTPMEREMRAHRREIGLPAPYA
jgi:hypothetical protein